MEEALLVCVKMLVLSCRSTTLTTLMKNRLGHRNRLLLLKGEIPVVALKVLFVQMFSQDRSLLINVVVLEGELFEWTLAAYVIQWLKLSFCHFPL
jgi:hypothetical protein